MKIGLDVMGGDYAPVATIEGAILALEKLASSDRIFLFGPQETIEDIIIADIRMPGMDGFEFLQKVKRSRKLKHIPR